MTISSIELLAGASVLQMVDGEQTFRVAKGSEGANQDFISITLRAPDLQADGLHLQTWASSYLLANRLHRIPITFSSFPSSPSSTTIPSSAPSSSSSSAPPSAASIPTFDVLELGAGTGLVGLSAAAVWGRRVMLTDFAPIVPGTAANAALNAPALASCGSLDWRTPETLAVHTPLSSSSSSSLSSPSASSPSNPILIHPSPVTRPRVVLSADTLYTDEQPALLATTIVTWLQRSPEARAIVAYPLRVAALDAIRDFWDRMERSGLQSLNHAQERVEGDEWDDEKLHEWSVWAWASVPTDEDKEGEGEEE